jgi:hypothetical protein
VTTLAWFALAVAGALVGVLVNGIVEWFPWLARQIVHGAARLLQPPWRARYRDEWLAELDALPTGGVTRLVWAIWVLLCAPGVRSARERSAEPKEVLPVLPLNTVEGMVQLLRQRADVRASLEDVFTHRALDHDESQPRFADLPVEIDQLYIDSVDNISNLDVVGIHELPDGTLDVEVTLDLAASLGVYVHKSEAFPHEGADIDSPITTGTKDSLSVH